MSRGSVGTRSYAGSFTNAVVVRVLLVSLFLYKSCSHIIIARCRDSLRCTFAGKRLYRLAEVCFCGSG